VALVGATRDEVTGDAATMLQALPGIGIEVETFPHDDHLGTLRDEIGQADLIVDGLLGTGLSGPARGTAAAAIEAVNASGALVVAVDIPSGLSGDSSHIPGPAVQADITVTFACPKVPHLLPPAEAHVGHLEVVDIGIPPEAVEAEASQLEVLEETEVARHLPFRTIEAHKGDFGRVLVIAGSVGMAGAAALVARAAQRIGAGLVTVATPDQVRPEVAALSPETLTHPLESAEAGGLGPGAAAQVLGLLEQATVLTVGPGLGLDLVAQEQVRTIVRESRLPLVLDADGLNAFAGARAAALDGSGRTLILTPHPGEMARLLDCTTAEVQDDRVAAVRRCAARHQAVVVLKGYRSLVGLPDGRVSINPTGNSGLATGGSGDVLTGMMAGLLAQGLPARCAATLATYAHGLAGDLAAEAGTEATLVAGDLLDTLPKTWDRLSRCALEELPA
jgi:NAD(P)H-hydrate epimerase